MFLARTRLAGVMVIAALLPACSAPSGTSKPTAHVSVTMPKKSDVAIPRQYACQIRSDHHINVRTPVKGYLTAIKVKEGQTVKSGDLLFEINSTLDKDRQQLENEDGPGQIKAPFEGVIGSLAVSRGSAVQTGAALATLSDSSLMRIDFTVSEARYRDYQRANLDQHPEDVKVELVVNGSKYNQAGKLDITAMNLNPEDGQYTLRAHFPNPDGLLRHGQAGIAVVSLTQHDAIVIPRRAVFEDRNERYVYVIDQANVAHRRQVDIRDEVDDVFVIKSGVGVEDVIVLDGVGKVQDGDPVQYDPVARTSG